MGSEGKKRDMLVSKIRDIFLVERFLNVAACIYKIWGNKIIHRPFTNRLIGALVLIRRKNK